MKWDQDNCPDSVWTVLKSIVEYALRDTMKPMGVAAYQITASLTEHLKGSLPTVEELEVELKGVEGKENGNP